MLAQLLLLVNMSLLGMKMPGYLETEEDGVTDLEKLDYTVGLL